MSSSAIPSRCLTSARSELPCRRDQHRVTGGEIPGDVTLPVRQHAVDDELEALGTRNLAVDADVARVVHLAVLGVIVEHGRRGCRSCGARS